MPAALRAAIVVNELSWSGPCHDRDESGLLEILTRALVTARARVSTHHSALVDVALPEDLWRRRLPRGSTLGAVLVQMRSAAQRDLAHRLKQFIDTGHRYPASDPVAVDMPNGLTVSHRGQAAAGFRYVLESQGVALSLDVDEWRKHPVDVDVCRGDEPAARVQTIAHVWSDVISDSQLAPVGAIIPLLPAYENPGHHDPEQPNQYIPSKSQLPRRPRRLLESALPEPGGTWWAFCEHRFYHRFQGRGAGPGPTVHWNGTTNPRARQVTREEDVPIALRKALSARPVDQCGCREI